MSGQNEPSQINGNLKSVQGQVVEQIGNLTGSTEWQQSGKQTHAEGEAEQKAAQAKAYAEGAADRVGGYKDSVVGAVTGDKAQQSELQRDKGGKVDQAYPSYLQPLATSETKLARHSRRPTSPSKFVSQLYIHRPHHRLVYPAPPLSFILVPC